ncbi:MAG: hypothetical protein K6F73_07835 [Lachnospiraceae bacterium]|nr:hypothetical protein [Lachnospiraceae bacterium]
MKRNSFCKNMFRRTAVGFMTGVLCLSLGGSSYKTDVIAIDDESSVVMVTENHELPIAYADGDFSGENSHSEQESSGVVNSDTEDYSFNIYEIVPEYGCGYFGYLIGGCESIYPSADPFDKGAVAKSKVRAAQYMDALCNLNPGGNNGRVNNLNLGIDDGGKWHFGIWYNQKVKGFYERVEDNKGVYKYVDASEANGSINSVNMKSRATNESGNYNFVWNYGVPDSSRTIITQKNQISGMKVGEVIYLDSYTKNIYCNNESFLTLFYSEGKDSTGSTETIRRLSAEIDGVTQTVDGTNGAYKIKSEDSRTVERERDNKKIVDAWKQANGISVFVKTAADFSDDDLNNADLIIISPGAPKNDIVSYYNLMNDTEFSNKAYSSSNDLSWKQVLDIYDHVVNKQDVAIGMCKANFGTLKNADLNIAKLQWLLYSVKQNNVNKWHDGSGREFFNDIIYEPELGYTGACNDYVRLTADKVSYKDGGGNWRERKDWWKIDDPNPFNECFLCRNTDHDLAGRYGITTDNSMEKGQFSNMMLFETDTEMTKIGYSDGYFKNILKSRVKAKHSISTTKLYYLSMDILNGDSKPYGVDANASNKILYVNEYELTPRADGKYTKEIPIHFRVFTNTGVGISEVEVYKGAAKVDENTRDIVRDNDGKPIGTLVARYTDDDIDDMLTLVDNDPPEQRSVTNSTGTVIGTVTVEEYEDAERKSDGSVKKDSIKVDIKNADLMSGSKYNQITNIVVVVTNEYGKSVADSIRIVKRNFFSLN